MVITKKCTFAGYLLLSNKTTRHGFCFSFPYSLKQQQYMELFPASHRSFPSSPTTMRWFHLSLDRQTDARNLSQKQAAGNRSSSRGKLSGNREAWRTRLHLKGKIVSLLLFQKFRSIKEITRHLQHHHGMCHNAVARLDDC